MSQSQANSVWRREVLERLEVLARRRVSATDISDTINSEFGVKTTPSAVSSKAWREGLRLLSSPQPRWCEQRRVKCER